MAAQHLDEMRVFARGPDRSGWQMIQRMAPGIQSCRPSATAAATVPISDGERARRAAEQQRFGERAVERDGKAGERSWILGHGDDGASGKVEEGQEEARRGKSDREAEDDLDQPPKSAGGVAEGERQAR